MRRLALLALLGVLVSCGASPPTSDASAPSDGGNDAAASVDAFAPVDAPPLCDVSPAPSGLSMLTGGFVVLGADGVLPIPAQTGGDPTGVWRFDRITIYTESASAGMFDPATSTISGTGWVVVEGNLLRLELTLDVALMGTVAGTVRRHTVTSIRGTFVVLDASLMLTPECISPAPTGAAAAPMFTAGMDGTGTILLTTMGMLGTNRIVLNGVRTAT